MWINSSQNFSIASRRRTAYARIEVMPRREGRDRAAAYGGETRDAIAPGVVIILSTAGFHLGDRSLQASSNPPWKEALMTACDPPSVRRDWPHAHRAIIRGGGNVAPLTTRIVIRGLGDSSARDQFESTIKSFHVLSGVVSLRGGRRFVALVLGFGRAY